MNYNNIAEFLKEYDQKEVNNYISYLQKLETDKYTYGQNKGKLKNPWFNYRKENELASYFIVVKKDGLIFDGKHISLQSTGVSYDYTVYKNKMLLVYPETILDTQLVFENDKFKFKKESGHVIYTHEINDPFSDDLEKNVIGGYCIIKNKRGEFITTLSRSEIEKHRKVAKSDNIWEKWFLEMCLKTVIKKACKKHFDDIYQNIETIDNENYDLNNPLGISIETKQEIEQLKTVEELEKYYRNNIKANSGIKEDFINALSNRKEEIQKGEE